MTLFEAYVTNAGKYADYGVDAGEILKFPTTTEEVQSLLKRIGVDGVRYQEIFIVSFDGDVLGLYDYLSEYENLDELNHLAHLLSELDQGELETLEAVLNKGDHIQGRMAEAGISNLSAYIRKMALNGYVLHVDLSDIRELVSLQRRCANNLNQVAIQANTYGGIYPEEIAQLQKDYAALWEPLSDLLKKLSAVTAL